jgi:hypothetical protein
MIHFWKFALSLTAFHVGEAATSSAGAACLADDVASLIQTEYKLNRERLDNGTLNQLSRLESEGFMDEPDAGWKMRKVRHEDQMRIQMKIMTSCRNVFPAERVCVPGCSSESKYSSSSFFACRVGVLTSQPSRPRQSTTVLSSSLSACSAPLVDTECSAETFWQTHYEPSFSCEFARRIGNAGEGGKWVCDPYKLVDKVKAGKGCLVYSVGSNGQYDFEESVHESISPGCEIHTIDMNDWQHYGGEAPPEYVHYHKYKVGVPPTGTLLSTIVQELRHAHKVIDLFKIDCEGCEWDTFRGWFGQDVHIQQVLVELHGTGSTNDGPNAHDFFNFLFDQGYVVFNKEPNTLGCRGSCIEYAFLKLSPEFSRSNELDRLRTSEAFKTGYS